MCITSYQLVVKDAAVFRRKKWVYMVLDEAHNIKNFQSERWQVLLHFNTKRRLLLTGILKAAIVSEGFVALALILDRLNGACDLGAFAVMPDALLLGVIAVYFGKCAGHLKDIFAVTDRQLSDAGLPAYQPQAEPAAHELPEEGGEG